MRANELAEKSLTYLKLQVLRDLRGLVDRELVIWICDGIQWLRGRKYRDDPTMLAVLGTVSDDVSMGVRCCFDLCEWIFNRTRDIGSPVEKELNHAIQPITHMARLAWLDKMIYDLEHEHD